MTATLRGARSGQTVDLQVCRCPPKEWRPGQAVDLQVRRWPPNGMGRHNRHHTRGAPKGAPVAAQRWLWRNRHHTRGPLKGASVAAQRWLLWWGWGGPSLRQNPRGQTQTAPSLAHIPAIALPIRPLHGLSLKICSGEGGAGGPHGGWNRPAQGIKLVAVRRFKEAPPVVCSDAFLASIIHARSNIGSRNYDAQMAET